MDLSHANMGGTGEAAFDQEKEAQRKEELVDRLRQGPGEAARLELDLSDGLTPSRWRLRTIRASTRWLSGYTLSGVWRLLKRLGLRLRSGRIQQYSPDPDYAEKEAHLLCCLEKAACFPKEVVFLFMDEMGYYRWPVAASDWCPADPADAPLADRQKSKQKQWRIVGVLNALSGQVNYLDGYVVGRAKVIEMYRQVVETYSMARRIYVAQDNWSIHRHDDVLEALNGLSRIEPVWLPTYAPWLNPIEKLWRWLRQDVLKLHRLAGDWRALRGQVNGFLDQFAQGSEKLLRYAGLSGTGKLARALHPV